MANTDPLEETNVGVPPCAVAGEAGPESDWPRTQGLNSGGAH